MKIYDPENIKITIGEWEITGFDKGKLIIKPRNEGFMKQEEKLKIISDQIQCSLYSIIKFSATIGKPLSADSHTRELFMEVIGEIFDTAVEKGEIDAATLYDIPELSPLQLSYGTFISGTEYLCSLKENEKGKLDLAVKEK